MIQGKNKTISLGHMGPFGARTVTVYHCVRYLDQGLCRELRKTIKTCILRHGGSQTKSQ